ncbi:MAG: flagellar basal body rod protein FlgB [Rhodospirillales bacterium]|jgi:flagellar basal-body rod protein FlgB|nr:flagellar basal body rod protein FlgB [Rhodospirillales bacterium]
MATAELPLFSALQRRGNWLAQRQVAIAENIANADTPHFHPRDLKPQRFRDLIEPANAVTLAATSPGHLSPAGGGGAAGKAAPSRAVYETAPSGNAVVLEEQMAKMNETAIDHRLVTQLYKKFLGMMRLAATARG